MKDAHSALFRFAFALALVIALSSYAYFLYPPLRAQLSGNMHERLALEKEKDGIAEIMLDPGLISERITDMQGQLLQTRPIKDLTPAGVTSDITRSIDEFGLELQSVSLGVPEAPGGAVVADMPLLLSMPVTIRMKAPYDGGMYFVSSLEKSETGTYKIGAFSFELSEKEAPQAGDAGAVAADDTDDGGAVAADEDAGGAEDPYPMYDWVLTVYLLYYG
ncbi:MAG: hypothetical protein LBS24_00715 [Clostridiales Family XIII bacterium]|jgi:hypothetical protein|nr:hypothetical protein [Clostridiales Family XIII bacterium]